MVRPLPYNKKTHTMKTKFSETAKIAGVLKMLEYALKESDRLWETREESHAYIVGYLRGAVKIAIDELK